MKLLRIGPAGSERPAVLSGDGHLLSLTGITRDIDGGLLGADGIERVRAALAKGGLPEISADALRIGPPAARPGKTVCIGLNYRDHAEETGTPIPLRSVVFMKDPCAVAGPHDQVLFPVVPGSVTCPRRRTRPRRSPVTPSATTSPSVSTWSWSPVT